MPAAVFLQQGFNTPCRQRVYGVIELIEGCPVFKNDSPELAPVDSAVLATTPRPKRATMRRQPSESGS